MVWIRVPALIAKDTGASSVLAGMFEAKDGRKPAAGAKEGEKRSEQAAPRLSFSFCPQLFFNLLLCVCFFSFLPLGFSRWPLLIHSALTQKCGEEAAHCSDGRETGTLATTVWNYLFTFLDVNTFGIDMGRKTPVAWLSSSTLWVCLFGEFQRYSTHSQNNHLIQQRTVKR